MRISFCGPLFNWAKLAISIERATTLVKAGGSLDISNHAGSIAGFRIVDVDAPYNKAAALGNGYVLVPDSADMRENFGGCVSYVDDPAAEATSFIRSGTESIIVDGRASNVARIKGKAWADQDEYRFVLFAAAGPTVEYTSAPSVYEEALLDMIQAGGRSGEGLAPPNVKYIDLPLATSSFREMTVTLGPKISDADRNAVTVALEEWAPMATVQSSDLRLR